MERIGHGAWSAGGMGHGGKGNWDMEDVGQSEGNVRVIGAWSDGYLGRGADMEHEVMGM